MDQQTADEIMEHFKRIDQHYHSINLKSLFEMEVAISISTDTSLEVDSILNGLIHLDGGKIGIKLPSPELPHQSSQMHRDNISPLNST